MGARGTLTLTTAVAAATLAIAPAQAAPTQRQQAERTARAIVKPHAQRLPGQRRAKPKPVSLRDCVRPAGDPAPGTRAWENRDTVNQYCATERLIDEYGNPAFGATFWAQTPGVYAGQNVAMLLDPTHPHATLGQLVPGGTTADPFRTIRRWTQARRGRVTDISFPATDGAKLNGHLFRPPAHVPGPYPGVVITTGSIQGYQEMYYWAAQGLAEAGYMVLTYDVQGQGNSDTLPADCAPDDCPGVPFQQAYNFFQGTEDALNWFFSARNPHREQLAADRVGLAGHSLGASAVSAIGQCDPRVRAIVAWDNLSVPEAPCPLETPALGINAEYFFNPTSQSSPPDPGAKAGAYREIVAAGTDAMQVALRSSTHLEWTYVPYILPASRYGERVAYHYTQAWFDRYLRGSDAAFDRLTAKRFDASADVHSIGAGGYVPKAAAARPADTAAGNAPYRIAGMRVADRVSIYYDSAYSLTAPGGAPARCDDMRAGCTEAGP